MAAKLRAVVAQTKETLSHHRRAAAPTRRTKRPIRRGGKLDNQSKGTSEMKKAIRILLAHRALGGAFLLGTFGVHVCMVPPRTINAGKALYLKHAIVGYRNEHGRLIETLAEVADGKYLLGSHGEAIEYVADGGTNFTLRIIGRWQRSHDDMTDKLSIRWS